MDPRVEIFLMMDSIYLHYAGQGLFSGEVLRDLLNFPQKISLKLAHGECKFLNVSY